ncbi:MAG: hypothetical protein D6790_14905 [Caldilineae bacterium]|nr:MAG: hypothetical protein D6790_14905 [Caldilineae bacterium]
MREADRIGFTVLAWLALMAGTLLLAGCCAPAASTHYTTHAPEAPIPAVVPALPFPDNPDPALCGIPEPFGDDRPGLITNQMDGKEIQPIIYLYDSHLHKEITGQVFPNTRVKVLLRQSNPALDFYFVESMDLPEVQRGWVPAPFLILPDDL